MKHPAPPAEGEELRFIRAGRKREPDARTRPAGRRQLPLRGYSGTPMSRHIFQPPPSRFHTSI